MYKKAFYKVVLVYMLLRVKSTWVCNAMSLLELSMWLGLLSGIVGVVYVLSLVLYITRTKIVRDTEEARRAYQIHEYIKSASIAYIKAQYTVILSIVSVISVILIVIGVIMKSSIVLSTGIAYLLGGLSSAMVSITGMLMGVLSNIRVLNVLIRRGLGGALSLAFRGGSVTGFLVGGVGLLGVSGLFIALNGFSDPVSVTQILLGYAFGASTAALFARVGGGIYTKAADIGADLVGKVEVGIPEDDPRNPGVIADNVGDNVGDCAGMGADLFESYVEGMIAPMVIAAVLWSLLKESKLLDLIAYPVIFSSMALLTSIAVAQLISLSPFKEPGRNLTATSILSIVATAVVNGITTYVLAPTIAPALIVGALGLVAGAIVGFTSDYFTSPQYTPVKIVARNSQFGPALTILSGLSMGFYSTFIPSIAIALAALGSYVIGSSIYASEKLLVGIYSVALAGTGMLAVAPIVVSADAYGPIVDNAAGLAEQAGYEEDVRSLADMLDSAGNTMKSISKGYAIGSAALTALALLFSFASVLASKSNLKVDALMQIIFSAGSEYGAYFISGVIIGVVMVALFTAMVIQAVTATAGRLVDEIRRQFREKPGILDWKERPDYERAVQIVTFYALRRLVTPGLLALLAPIIIALVGPVTRDWHSGATLLGGLLLGSIASGLLLGLFQGNVGNTWDNAKKYIEAGNFGGKGTETHKAAVVGDTVGDPLKDSAGPAINIMIKVMAVSSSVIVPLILFGI
jgi:K(+)-stimulated pyrophosphate-energized sodium pump